MRWSPHPAAKSPHHAVAITWLETALASCRKGERLQLLPMVTAGFLQLVTHPRVLVEPPPVGSPGVHGSPADPRRRGVAAPG